MKKLALSFLVGSFTFANAQLHIRDIASHLESSIDGNQAMQSARFFTQFWRIAGGSGFDTCISFLELKLGTSGFERQLSVINKGANLSYFVQEDKPTQSVWLPSDARLGMEIPELRTLLSFSSTPLMLCRNSFSQDIRADIIYARGGGKEEDYEKLDVTGKIMLCDDPPSAAFPLALSRGALGVISSYVPEYNNAQRFPDIISEGSIPYDDQKKSFALKISPRIAEDLKRLLRYTQVTVSVKIQSKFVQSPIKTLIAEIRGTSRPNERVLIIAHLDHYKPGANDNASGSAALLEIARSVSDLIKRRKLPALARTMTFLWVDEIQGSEFWIRQHESELADVKGVFVMDMVGGDPEKTGGVFRIERTPDPSVIWMRRPDHHSGWGIGSWPKEKLKGHFLNDFQLSVVDGTAKRTKWKFDFNPFEGGSDHVPFLERGIPAILAWHFPDYFYHSSLDDMDKLSASEMKNAAISVGTAALGLAYGTEQIAREILDDVALKGKLRLENEKDNSTVELGDVQTQDKETADNVKTGQREILEAWGKWYEEAVQSVVDVPINPTQGFLQDVQKEKERIQNFTRMMLAALGL